MSRQSIRPVVQVPQDVYTNFSKGMEFNTHSKDTSNPRVQMIRNMEIDSDGKLSVRRPLIPHILNGYNWVNMWVDVKGQTLLQVVYAPFRKLDVPFIWILQDELGNNYAYYLNTETNNIVNLEQFSTFWNQLSDDFETVFISGEDRLLFNTTNNGLFELRYDNVAKIFSCSTIEDYTPTFQDLTESGANLYLNNPFFINNIIREGDGDSVGIGGLLPYSPYKREAFDPEHFAFEPSELYYNTSPTRQDQIFLKALLDIPRNFIKAELLAMFTMVGNNLVWKEVTLKDGSKINFGALLRSRLSGGTSYGDWTSEPILKNLFPRWTWFKVVEGGATTPIKPTNNIDIRMPLLASLATDDTAKARVLDIAKEADVFGNKDLLFDLGTFFYDLKDGYGYRTENRMDIYTLKPGVEDSIKYKLQIDFDNTKLMDYLQESILNATNIQSLILETAGDGKFSGKDFSDIYEAINPLTNKLLALSPELVEDRGSAGAIKITYESGKGAIFGVNVGQLDGLRYKEVDPTATLTLEGNLGPTTKTTINVI